MTEALSQTSIRDAVETRLAKRYRSELRFRAAGLTAIGISIVILLVLLGSIANQGLSAFWANEMTLEVELDPALVDPQGDGLEASIRAGSYSRVLQNAMREQFPEVRNRRDLRQLFQLYTALNAPRLMEEVLARPSRIGTTYDFRMPIADDMDLYLKGQLVDEREFAGSGPLSIAEEGRGYALTSQDGEFAGLFAEIRDSLVLEAVALEARAGELDRQSGDLAPEDRDANAGRAADIRSRAEALRAVAAGDVIELDDEMPSLFVEINGGAFKLGSLSSDGRSASASQLVTPTDLAADDAWTLLVVETPEARRRSADNQIIWTRALRDRGVVQSRFNTYLFTNADSREPELAGVKGALYGSILTILVTMLLSVPVGVFAAIYLEEFAPKNRFTDLIEVNINNLAAVPSIVFGLLGLSVFINLFGLPRSAPILGGLVLSLMTLPTMIIATRAALKAVPPSIREAALGVGASQTQSVFHHVLPLAAPGILTGSIIGLARALGETAPLLMIGMVAFIADPPSLSPEGLMEPATVMPVQIFLWYDGAERAFEARTAAAILVLLTLMIGLNALAIYLRRRFERRW